MLLGGMVSSVKDFADDAEMPTPEPAAREWPTAREAARLRLGARDWGAGVDMELRGPGHDRAAAFDRDALLSMFAEVEI